ncbi:MAG: PPOX class F420-dependent oxidoreductase, partial [Actinomycetia bacterium]|nr:PPOX class F420-dependent oxidoreductase [Actinomycetes bacterium]
MSSPDPDALEAFLAEPRNAMIAGVRRDGRPHLTPNWFLWDSERFYVSTTKDRVKYRIFSHDPRVQVVVDDVMGFRYVIVDGTVEISEDVESGLGYFRALRHKHGRTEQDDAELRQEMIDDGRVLLVITPDRPPS